MRPSTLAASIRKFFPPGLPLHVGTVSTSGLAALKAYTMKKDATYREGPWDDRSLVRSEEDKVIEECKEEYKDIVWRPFQQNILDMLLIKPDKRGIIWIYDKKGNAGKSHLCNYLHLFRKVPILQYTDTKRILYLVSQMPRSSCYVFDLTKAKPKDIGNADLYAAMEQIKNGIFMNTFQKPCQFVMKPPHIVVFSNRMPETKYMSQDRWHCYEVTEVYSLVKLSCRALETA